MEVLAERSEQQLCDCYKEDQEFQKIMVLNDSGLEMYLHRIYTGNIRQGEVIESSVNPSGDVFILQNKKDVKVTTSKITLELENKYMSCSRCRNILKHAQELVQELKSIDRKIIIGICDYCRKKALVNKKSFCDCDKIVKIFKSFKALQLEDPKKYLNKVWPSKKEHVRKDKLKEISSYSNLQITQDLISPAAENRPEVQQVFFSHFESGNKKNSGTGLKTGYVKKTSTQLIKPKKITFDYSPHEIIDTKKLSTSLVDIDTSLAKTNVGDKELRRPAIKHRQQEEIFKDTLSMDAKEELKRRHDFSLRQLVKRKKDSGFAELKTPDVYGITKLTPREQDESTPKYHVESEMDIKIISKRKPHDLDSRSSDYASKRKTKYESSEKNNNVHDYFEPSKPDKYSQDKIKKGSHDLEERAKPAKNLKDSYSDLKLGRSVDKVKKLEQRGMKSKSRSVEAQFSYVFPKAAEKKIKKISVKSAELIKNIREKLKERRQKLEPEEKIKLSQEKKKRQVEEQTKEKDEDMAKEKKLKVKEEEMTKLEEEEKSTTKKTGKTKKKKPTGLESEQNSSSHVILSTSKDNINIEGQFKNLQAKKLIKQAKSSDYLQPVKTEGSKKITPLDIDFELLRAHTAHHKGGRKLLSCPLCWDSELELEDYSMHNEKNKKKDKTEHIIIGEKLYKYKSGLEKHIKPGIIPILFQKDNMLLETDLQLKEKVQITPQEPEQVRRQILSTNLSKKDEKENDFELRKGIIRYALSDRSFIEKGWTVLPTEKVVRMMNVYRMRPAHPEFDWFEHNKSKGLMTYDTGERLAEFDDNGRGRWYYRNGRLALDYYDAEETNVQQRFVVYSSGEPDERGRTHPITILATFDYLGNGIVFDHAGKIRLKYNQTEGVLLDRSIGPVSHWKWHTLNDPPVLQQVMIDTQLPQKDPDILKFAPSVEKTIRPENDEMITIEFDNFIKEKSKKLSQKFKPFQIKMKALKINEHFSLRVLDQATVYLIFRDGLTNLKVNIGMILDDKEIVDTHTAEVGEVSNSLERFPAHTDSLEGLQRSVAHAQRYERQHAERERRLHFPVPCASVDLMTAAASPPIRLPLRTVPTGSTSTTRYCSRKPSNNLYYDTRFFC